MTQNYQPPKPPCAVVDCMSVGKPHQCPADGEAHGHGRIHYTYCGDHGLTFRDGWGLVCDEHYSILVASRRAMEGK